MKTEYDKIEKATVIGAVIGFTLAIAGLVAIVIIVGHFVVKYW